MPASSGATWRSSSATWESSGLSTRLYDAGVYVSIEEFRGARPIERPGLSLPVRASDFDNPLAASGWRVTTGASRSLGRQVLLNFDHLDRQLLYIALFIWANGTAGRPEAMWRPFAARNSVGNAIRAGKLGRGLDRWFSQTRATERPFRARETALTAYALLASRLWGKSIPVPEHVPLAECGSHRPLARRAGAARHPGALRRLGRIGYTRVRRRPRARPRHRGNDLSRRRRAADTGTGRGVRRHRQHRLLGLLDGRARAGRCGVRRCQRDRRRPRDVRQGRGRCNGRGSYRRPGRRWTLSTSPRSCPAPRS